MTRLKKRELMTLALLIGITNCIISVQSDWGGEYHNLNSFFQKLGISHRVSCPHTYQQNGVAERKHRHIVETGLTLLAHASVPFCYWSECFYYSLFSDKSASYPSSPYEDSIRAPTS
jgi:hypothetical protein